MIPKMSGVIWNGFYAQFLESKNMARNKNSIDFSGKQCVLFFSSLFNAKNAMNPTNGSSVHIVSGMLCISTRFQQQRRFITSLKWTLPSLLDASRQLQLIYVTHDFFENFQHIDRFQFFRLVVYGVCVCFFFGKQIRTKAYHFIAPQNAAVG